MNINDYYNPHRALSYKVYFVNDILPKEYHEQYEGWTLDGAYDHREDENSPWNKIIELNLLDTVLYPIVEKGRQEESTHYIGLMVAYKKLVEEIQSLRKELRIQKKFDVADKLRHILNKFHVEIRDEKAPHKP